MDQNEAYKQREMLFNLAKSKADDVKELPRTRNSRVFEFRYNGGTFEGDTVMKLNWLYFTPMNVISLPGFDNVKREVEAYALDLLQQYSDQQPSAEVK